MISVYSPQVNARRQTKGTIQNQEYIFVLVKKSKQTALLFKWCDLICQLNEGFAERTRLFNLAVLNDPASLNKVTKFTSAPCEDGQQWQKASSAHKICNIITYFNITYLLLSITCNNRLYYNHYLII